MIAYLTGVVLLYFYIGFCVLLCKSLFVLFILVIVFSVLLGGRVLITPLVFSNFSYNNGWKILTR